MNALTREQAAEWCRERGITFDVHGVLGYGGEPTRRLDAKLPTNTAGLIYAARLLTRLETHGFYASPRQSEGEFEGCLIWIVDYKTWSTVSQEIGAYAFMHLGIDKKAQTGSIDLTRMPARLFDAGEAIAATTTLLQPLLFQWDAYIITESGNYIAYISNDGSIRGITARSPEMLEAVKPIFADFGIREGMDLNARRQRIRI